MKNDLHPTYVKQAVITCACGNQFDVGSTAQKLAVEVCSACHPYYTGKQKLVDVAGRIDKFKKRLKESEKIDQKKPAKKAKKSAGAEKDDTVKLGR